MIPFLVGFRICEQHDPPRLFRAGAKNCPADGAELRLMSDQERVDYARKMLGEFSGVITQCAAGEEAEMVLLGKAIEWRVDAREALAKEIRDDLEASGYVYLPDVMQNPERYDLQPKK